MPFEAQLVLVVLFGAAGWHHARSLEKKYGSRAWGMDAWLWGVITGLSLLVGVILMALAERALKKAPLQAPLGIPGYAPAYPVVPAQATAPVEAAPVEAVLTPVAAVPAPIAAVPAPAAPAAPPAGWHPDPSGKFDHRWWDGQRWTANVSTNGVAGTDA